jgi:hypothetical protein
MRPGTMILLGVALALAALWGGAWVLQAAPEWAELPTIFTAVYSGAIGAFLSLGGFARYLADLNND